MTRAAAAEDQIAAWAWPWRRALPWVVSGHQRRALFIVYGAMTVLITAYLVSLVVRSPAQSQTWLDGWGVVGFEVLASGACFARALIKRPGRAVAVVLGVGLLSWTLGDLFLTIESLGGASPPTPSTADAFYLNFYPWAYVAMILLLRRHARTIAPRSWLDGGIAGAGAAAVCAAFAFHTIVHSTGGDALGTATNLAYPVGDALLLGLVVGGCAVVPRGGRTPWLALAFGVGINVVGDTFNLFPSASATHVGNVFEAFAWPASILSMSLAVWLVPGRPDMLAPDRAPGSRCQASLRPPGS